MRKDESFYTVSTKDFQNLTNIFVVEDLNPGLDPSNLTVGVEVVFPLLCKCSTKVLNESGYLVTYVWQPHDELASVSGMFQSSSSEIVAVNNNRNFTSAVCLPVLVPVESTVILQSFASEDSSRKSHSRSIVVAILSVVMVFLVVSSGLALYFRVLYKKNRFLARSSSSLETFGLIRTYNVSKDEAVEPKNFQDKLLHGVSGYLCKPVIYDFDVIMKATSDLSERCRIGRSLYKAVINGQDFVVKKTREANEELQILQRVNHSNLVKLVGVSMDDDGSLFIVYEYVRNGSLENWLFPSISSAVVPLSWKQRLLIALDVANGLQYLHEHTQTSVAHKDISTRNILLDYNFKAKISNFSAAREISCPMILNVDVFCFGVVLLELLSGRKVMETKENGEVVMLWVEMSEIMEGGGDQRKERLRKWMDPKLKRCFSIDDALSLAAMAKACTSDKSSERPTMAEVVFSLSVIVQSSPLMYEKPWISNFEAEVVYPIIAPVKAR